MNKLIELFMFVALSLVVIIMGRPDEDHDTRAA